MDGLGRAIGRSKLLLYMDRGTVDDAVQAVVVM